jgi:hypothetical protein
VHQQQQQQGASTTKQADPWPEDYTEIDSGPAERHLFIEDGAGGCWVTFAADVAGKCVLIGRGAFSKVRFIFLPCCLRISAALSSASLHRWRICSCVICADAQHLQGLPYEGADSEASPAYFHLLRLP